MEGKPPIAAWLWKLIPGFVQVALLKAFAAARRQGAETAAPCTEDADGAGSGDVAQRLLDEIQRLQDDKDRLAAENERLRVEVAQWKERAGKNSRNSSLPPSSDRPHVKRRPPKKPAGRSRGGQPGHAKHEQPLLPPEEVNETIPCRPDHCEHCGTALVGEDPAPQRFQHWEIPPVKPVVNEYQLHRLSCPQCGKATTGKLPEGVGPGHYGPRASALPAVLMAEYRLSKRLCHRLAKELFGLPISIGQVCRMQAATAAIVQPRIAELLDYIKNCHANIDETSWKEEKQRCYLWVAATEKAVVYLIRPTRGAVVLEELVGAEPTKVVTSDRAKAYDTLPLTLRQLCWSHLQRDFQAMIDRENAGSEIGGYLLDFAGQMFHWWHRLGDGTIKQTTFDGKIKLLREAVRETLELGVDCGCAKTAATCRELLAREPAMWTFAYVEGVEPTNNAGEREVRLPVIFRKLTYGTDSANGSRVLEAILSTAATCRRQSRAVWDFFTEAHTAVLQGRPCPSLLT